MAPRLIIESITGTTPFEFYVCDVSESICFYLGSVNTTLTNYFTLPSIFTTAPIIRIKMIDSNGCEVKKDLSCDFTCGFDLVINAVDCTFCISILPVPPSPTPTPSVTPTLTPTSSVTPTLTPTSSVTPTITQTPSVTPTITPTITPSSVDTFFILQENGDFILQENGDKIIWNPA